MVYTHTHTFTPRVPVIGKGSCTQSQMGFIQFDISESARRTGRFVTRPTLVVYDSCSLTGLRGVSYGNDFITSWVKLASLDKISGSDDSNSSWNFMIFGLS